MCDRIQYPIHELPALRRAKFLGDFNRLIHDHCRRGIIGVEKLETSQKQRAARNRVHALESPSRSVLLDHQLDLLLTCEDTIKERVRKFQISLPFLASAITNQRCGSIRRARITLEECLHDGDAGEVAAASHGEREYESTGILEY